MWNPGCNDEPVPPQDNDDDDEDPEYRYLDDIRYEYSEPQWILDAWKYTQEIGTGTDYSFEYGGLDRNSALAMDVVATIGCFVANCTVHPYPEHRITGSSEGLALAIFPFKGVHSLEEPANIVAKEFNGVVKPLEKGYKIEFIKENVEMKVRMMAEGSGGRIQPYFRLSVAGKGPLTVNGIVSSNRGLTHVDMSPNYLQQVVEMVGTYLTGRSKR